MPPAVSRIVLKPGREKSLRHRHPWVFSGAIASVDGAPASGDTVEVRDANGSFLALAAYSPESQIRARAWTYREAETVDAGFLRERLAAAIGRRSAMLDAGHTACRLVHAESDGLPGLVVDRYGEVLVVQVLSAGPERWKDEIVAALASITGLKTIFERSDVEVRTLEGLAPRTGADARGRPGPGGDRRGRDQVRGERRQRAEDRLLSRPARQPPHRSRPRRGRRGAQCVLLHGRVFARSACRRGEKRALDRLVRGGDRPGRDGTSR